jgi:uncharacterized protein (DUF1330 family)
MLMTRLRPGSLIRLFRRDLPRPVDVLNLLTIGDLESYRWYGLLVTPLLHAAGGSVRWAGRRTAHLHGPEVADRLLVVRYPSHRVWLAMIANPYYFAINRLRERGVTRFQASFTSPRSLSAFGRRALLLVVHFNARAEDALERIHGAVAVHGGDLVYAAREVSPIDFVDELRPTDPHPLELKRVAFFAFDAPALERARATGLVRDVSACADACAIQVYEREPLLDHVPRTVARWLPRTAHAHAP